MDLFAEAGIERTPGHRVVGARINAAGADGVRPSPRVSKPAASARVGMRLTTEERIPNRTRSRASARLDGRVHLPPARRKRTKHGTILDTGVTGSGRATVHWSGVIPSYVMSAPDRWTDEHPAPGRVFRTRFPLTALRASLRRS